MAMIYGADSVVPVNTRLTNGYTLFDWVMRMSCYPSFWGRTLLGDMTVTTDEIEFLHRQKCKVGFIVNNFSETEISSNEDVEKAMLAIKAMDKLGIPRDQGITIFAYINPDWCVNHNWMLSFAYQIAKNGYVPGFIGNTDSSLNFNFGRQCSHYVQANNKYYHIPTVYWATEPKLNFEPSLWVPYAPSQLLPQDMHLWNYGRINFHNICVQKSYMRDKSIMQSFF